MLQVCKQKSTKTRTPKAAPKAYNPFDESEDPVPISVDELMARRPGRTGTQSSQSVDAADDSEPVNEHEPKLNLPQLETGMLPSQQLNHMLSIVMRRGVTLTPVL